MPLTEVLATQVDHRVVCRQTGVFGGLDFPTRHADKVSHTNLPNAPIGAGRNYVRHRVSGVTVQTRSVPGRRRCDAQ
jgi:hypothetical protein